MVLLCQLTKRRFGVDNVVHNCSAMSLSASSTGSATCKPVLDDAPVRAFATMQEYRDWCEQNLPASLGYRRGSDDNINAADQVHA